MRTLLTLLLLGSGAALAQAITPQNWTNHPKVLEVRARFGEVEDLQRSGGMRAQTRTVKDCGGFDQERSLFTDARGVVRRYQTKSGSEDQAQTQTATYDASGTLRFVLTQQGATNGAQKTWRHYFDARGTRFWVDYRWKPFNYPFPNPLATVTKTPRVAFNAPGCSR